MTAAVEREIREMLARFQEGYARKDMAALDSFMREMFVECDDLLVVGTSSDEWCEGFDAVTELVGRDWEQWGGFSLDLEKASVTVKGSVGWVAAWGTVTRRIDADGSYEAERKEVEGLLATDEAAKEVCLKALASLASAESPQIVAPGGACVLPLRLTATVASHEGSWRFYQLHLSFPKKGRTEDAISADQQ